MHLHLVGGFLGSGKTTAIIGAAKLLLAHGKRVGVVTNDQGRYLVDTAFFRLAHLPTVEVTGGCFCCNYDDLAARLEQVVADARPDVIFAESVGSCADLVATVVKPLLSLCERKFAPRSFSVFADSRLLRRRLLGLEMPFSDDVVYIFDQQLSETGLLVVNKVDLLPPAELDDLSNRVAARYPGRAVLYQDSLAGPDGTAIRPIFGIPDWVTLIESGSLPQPQNSLEIDYGRYAAGEAALAWLDEEIHLDGAGVGCFVQRFLSIVGARLRAASAPVGHLKLLVRAGGLQVKLSLASAEDDGDDGEHSEDWIAAGFSAPAALRQMFGPAEVILNARVQMDAPALRALVATALAEASLAAGVTYRETAVSFFHPSFPHPTFKF